MMVLLLLLFPFAMIAAAISDILSMTIPNKLTLGLALCFFIAAPMAGMPLATIGLHAAVGFVALVIVIGFFSAGWMGGGDAKLVAAAALWFGPSEALLIFLLVSGLLGGALTLLLLTARGVIAPITGVAFIDRLLSPHVGVPYGVALGAAGLMAFPALSWVGPAAQMVPNLLG
ncbi:A24 family peptidase [Consotaella salsifontis]|uniref:Prepilin peptidase CpaA n=1 Tax=Consotaella salsifontis TaxID=1365950 RepID=A0A1T4S189_9HYPH|nr:prepilin peptidase [Consotaella salsifontis]SKA21846.1 prepilin peptidase CpaA [Consotaella salsifontis]